MSRYNPALIILHWFSACLILFQLSIGDLIAPGIHIIVGAFIAVMMVVRLSIKLRSANQHQVKTQSSIVNKLALNAHVAIYGLVFAVIISGIGLAFEI